jgi:hypothetical protein
MRAGYSLATRTHAAVSAGAIRWAAGPGRPEPWHPGEVGDCHHTIVAARPDFDVRTASPVCPRAATLDHSALLAAGGSGARSGQISPPLDGLQIPLLLLIRQLAPPRSQSACRSGRFRRLGRTGAAGRLGVWGYLVQPAEQAQHVRPFVPTLLVLPREVRRASDKQHVWAPAKGKHWDSRYPAKHGGSPAIDKAARSGAIALQPARSIVTPPA